MDQQKTLVEPIFVEKLGQVMYPGFNQSIIDMGLVTRACLKEGGVAEVVLRPITAPPEVLEKLEDDLAAAVASIPGVKELELDFPRPPQPKAQEAKGPRAIPGVKAVVPVASGKGGVGKSTVAVNLALGLKELGLKVGLLDLDLYGPSVPMMLGVSGVQPPVQGDKLLPVEAHGIKSFSIGYIIDASKALIWRGGLIMKAVKQLIQEVEWAPLDVLVLDLPPGTGDVQITMAQEVPISGAVVVTTPQDVALADAIKAVDMFQHINAPVLGIVENMSYFICPDCSSRHEIFGHGSVEPLAAKLGVDYLGELPLDPAVPGLADHGKAALEEASSAGHYREIARRVLDKLKPHMAAAEEA